MIHVLSLSDSVHDFFDDHLVRLDRLNPLGRLVKVSFGGLHDTLTWELFNFYFGVLQGSHLLSEMLLSCFLGLSLKEL